jgi:ribosomal protein L27
MEYRTARDRRGKNLGWKAIEREEVNEGIINDVRDRGLMSIKFL